MVRKDYDVAQMAVPSVSGQVASGAEMYDNPTFNRDDSDRPETEVGVTATVQSPTEKEKARFGPMPIERGDRIRLAFLIGFPHVVFLIAVIVTAAYV